MRSGHTLFRDVGGNSGTEVYGQGGTYQDYMRRRFYCPDYRVELTTGLMMVQRWRIYGTDPEIDCNRLLVSHTEHIPRVFEISFWKGTSQCPCPFSVCPGSSQTWNGLRNNFNRHNWRDRLRILEEHPTLFPKCERCGSQVPPWCLGNWNYDSNR